MVMGMTHLFGHEPSDFLAHVDKSLNVPIDQGIEIINGWRQGSRGLL